MHQTVKALLAAALAALGAYFRQLLIPFGVAVLAMGCDWLSGLVAAGVSGKLCSRTGIIGILKKVGYSLLILVGMAVDFVIHYAAAGLHIAVENFYYFGLLVTMWIIVNELISILENLVRIGLPVPGFLARLLHTLKLRAEAKGEAITGREEKP